MEARQRPAFRLCRRHLRGRNPADPEDQALDALVLAGVAPEILAAHYRRHLDDALVAETGLEQRRHRFGEVGRVEGRGRIFVTRSEEHTSELQSLMRISYAVLCLKTKNPCSSVEK